MFEIKNVVSVENQNLPFSPSSKRVNVVLDIEVSKDDSLYTEKGTLLQVDFDKVDGEIFLHYFFEKGTDRHMKVSMTEAEEEKMTEYINEYLMK